MLRTARTSIWCVAMLRCISWRTTSEKSDAGVARKSTTNVGEIERLRGGYPNVTTKRHARFFDFKSTIYEFV